MSDKKTEYDILFRSALRSPLGYIGATGTIFNSAGVGDNPMRILGSYAVVYLLDGSGQFRDANGFSSEVVAGDLILIFPDVAHCYGPTRGSYWNEFHAVFEGKIFDLWRTSGLLDETQPMLHLDPVEWWRKRFISLQNWARASSGNDAQNALRQACALQMLLADALAARSENLASGELDWLERARGLLVKNATSSTRLHDVAREMGMSYESFRKKFVALNGTSPGQFCLQQQMDRACEMLSAGSRNQEIAYALGFCDEYHFSRQFKKIVGTSPQEFRRRLPQGHGIKK